MTIFDRSISVVYIFSLARDDIQAPARPNTRGTEAAQGLPEGIFGLPRTVAGEAASIRAAIGRDAIIFVRPFRKFPPVLKLIASPTSPYVRKVRIALAEKKIECQMVAASPWEPGNPVHAFSPLGKVPVLVLDDGTQLFDSRVIVEYIDTVSPVSRLIPEPNRQRIEVKRWEALADGICDAMVAIVLEAKRPAKQQNKDWTERQRQKVAAGVAELARELAENAWCNGESYSLADIATGCAFGLPRLPQSRTGLASRPSEPGAACREAREASFLPGNPAAQGVTTLVPRAALQAQPGSGVGWSGCPGAPS